MAKSQISYQAVNGDDNSIEGIDVSLNLSATIRVPANGYGLGDAIAQLREMLDAIEKEETVKDEAITCREMYEARAIENGLNPDD